MDNYVIILLIWNIIVMLIYGIDKLLAKMGRRRISEFTLLLCAYLSGGFGAMFGMVLFNHKTSKIKFRLIVPLAIIIWTVAIYWIVKFFS